MHFDWLIAAPYFTVFITIICMTDFRKQQTLLIDICVTTQVNEIDYKQTVYTKYLLFKTWQLSS